MHEIKHLLYKMMIFANKIVTLLNINNTLMPNVWIVNKIYEVIESRKERVKLKFNCNVFFKVF